MSAFEDRSRPRPQPAPAGAAGGPAPRRPALRVGFVLAHNFTLSALSLFIDVLRLAADEGDRSRPIRCTWTVMASRPEAMRSSCGLGVNRMSALLPPQNFDYIVVVGGLLQGGDQVDEPTVKYLREAAAAGVTLVGVCTGSFVLSRAGLMAHRRVCVSWYHVQDFADAFPDQTPVADRLFVVDRDRITCSGGSGVADLAAYLVARHLGQSVSQKAMHVMQLQSARGADASQPHLPVGGETGDERVRRAVLIMEQNIAEPISIEGIAGRLAMSPRQLERLFQGTMGERPAAVYRRLRLGHARWLLENTRKSITDISVETGFCDAAHFSRQFRAAFGLAPSAARQGRAEQDIRPAGPIVSLAPRG